MKLLIKMKLIKRYKTRSTAVMDLLKAYDEGGPWKLVLDGSSSTDDPMAAIFQTL